MQNNQILLNNTAKTLLDMPSGARVRVVSYGCGAGVRSKLCALGITPGSELYLCESCGSVRIKIKECSLVLGRGIASKIICEQLQNQCCCQQELA